MRIENYRGCVVDVIYLDRKGNTTKRRVSIRTVPQEGRVLVYCYAAGAPRLLITSNILAVQLVKRMKDIG
ncbi:hypothetical protein ACFO9Q_01575 [Paenibacillus sp. GCM10023252]|uniref:hypothetical protein n=1 Tax=Paenibacillus sp. GCM10023252 TaxID=3252649 RepID=UPI003614DE60